MQFYSKAIGELTCGGPDGLETRAGPEKALQLRTRYLFISQART